MARCTINNTALSDFIMKIIMGDALDVEAAAQPMKEFPTLLIWLKGQLWRVTLATLMMKHC